ncbi:MAG: hypothetical protein H0T79_00510 [Deltaproteobacteria bacterium]|nr:hypothetical protein [Deltaproteobacteria bacterium]
MTQLLPEPARSIGWDVGGAQLAAVTRSGLHKVTLGTPVHAEVVSEGFHMRAALAGGHVFGAGPQRLSSDRGLDESFPGKQLVALAVGSSGTVIAGIDDGRIMVVDGARRQVLRSPIATLEGLLASPSSSLVLTLSRSHLFVWDLEALFPRRFAFDSARVQLFNVGPRRVLANQFIGRTDASRWIDLDTGVGTLGPALNLTDAIVGSPSGLRVIAVDHTLTMGRPEGGPARLLRWNTTAVRDLVDGVLLVAFVDEQRAVFAMVDGRLELRDLETNAVDPLGPRGPTPERLQITGDWLVAQFTDRSMVRIQISTRRREVAPVSEGTFGGIVMPDGQVYFADGPRVRSWKPDGQLVTHATLPSSILWLTRTDDQHLAVDTIDVGYIVATATPNTVRPTAHFGTTLTVGSHLPHNSVMSSSPGILAIPGVDGATTIIDGATGGRWLVGQAEPQASDARVSSDGTLLYQVRDHTLVVWPVDLPSSAALTAAMVARMTNAAIDPGGSPLRWP